MSASDVLAGDLRRICGHDSRSVDGCVTCEAADRIEPDYRQSAAVAELVEADKEYDAASKGYNPLFASRTEVDRYQAAVARRSAALARMEPQPWPAA